MTRRRGVYRGVYSVLQNDPDFRKLSPKARHTFLSMRLSESVGISCLWRYDRGAISAQTGYPLADLDAIFSELVEGRWIVLEGEWMWLRNALKYDPTVSLNNPRHFQGVVRAIAGIPRMTILRRFCRYYHLPYPFDTHSHPNGKASDRLSAPKLSAPRPNTDIPNTETEAIGPKGIKDEVLERIERIRAKHPELGASGGS